MYINHFLIPYNELKRIMTDIDCCTVNVVVRLDNDGELSIITLPLQYVEQLVYRRKIKIYDQHYKPGSIIDSKILLDLLLYC